MLNCPVLASTTVVRMVPGSGEVCGVIRVLLEILFHPAACTTVFGGVGVCSVTLSSVPGLCKGVVACVGSNGSVVGWS